MAWFYFALLVLASGVLFYVMMGGYLSQADKISKALLLATATLAPMVSLLIYQQRGAYDEVELVATMNALNEATQQPGSEDIEAFQQQLEAMTRARPGKAEYWFMLGGMRTEQQDFTGAVEAYQKASDLVPQDISLHARLAEAQFLADGYRLTEAVRGHIYQVLVEDPLNTTVLGILGISAYRAGQFEAAIRFWQRSLQALPPMSKVAQSIRASIEQAKQTAGLTNNSQESVGSGSGLASFIDLDVSLAETVAAAADNIVFVFARQFNGPPMPITVERLRVADLPVRIRLDDSKVMIEGRKLADFDQLELVARLSFSGQPMAQKGDYQKVIGPVVAAQVNGAVELEISERVTE